MKLLTADEAENLVRTLRMPEFGETIEVDGDALVEYVHQTHDPSLSADIVMGLTDVGFRSDHFSALLKVLAGGVDWDVEEHIRLAALLSLSDRAPLDDEVAAILRAALVSADRLIRSAAVVSAQYYCGIAVEHVIHGFMHPGEDIAKYVDEKVRSWLGIGTA